MRLTFGRHKGKDVREVPRDYLRWLLDNSEIVARDEDLREEIEDALDDPEPLPALRFTPPAPVPLPRRRPGWKVKSVGETAAAPKTEAAALEYRPVAGSVCRACGVEDFASADGRCCACGNDPLAEAMATRTAEVRRGLLEAIERWRVVAEWDKPDAAGAVNELADSLAAAVREALPE